VPGWGLLKITGVQVDRALLVGVEFASRPQALPRSSAVAREAAKSGLTPQARNTPTQQLKTPESESWIESKDGPGGWERSDFPRDRPCLTLIWV
jgi:hypothetical protein